MINKHIKNASYNSGFQLLGMIVSFITIPMLIHNLGLEKFGIYSLIITTIGFSGFLELGFSSGVVKFVAEENSRKNFDELNKVISSSLIFQTLVGIIAFLIIFFISGLLPSILNINVVYSAESSWAFRLTALTIPFALIFSLFIGVFNGLELFFYSSSMIASQSILSSVLAVIASSLGYNLVVIAAINLILNIVFVIVSIIVITQRVPQLKIKVYFYYKTWSRIFHFSIYLLISKISSFALDPFIRFFISVYFNPAAVSYFVAPTKLLSSITILFNKIGEIFYPISANANANGEKVKFKRIFLSSYKTSVLVIVPLFLLIAFFSRAILSFWIGNEFADKAWLIMTILSFSYMIAALTTMIWNIALGYGLSKFAALCSFFVLFAITLFIIPLSILFGIKGTSGAILLSSLNGIFAIFYVIKKIFGLSPKQLFKELVDAPYVDIKM